MTRRGSCATKTVKLLQVCKDYAERLCCKFNTYLPEFGGQCQIVFEPSLSTVFIEPVAEFHIGSIRSRCGTKEAYYIYFSAFVFNGTCLLMMGQDFKHQYALQNSHSIADGTALSHKEVADMLMKLSRLSVEVITSVDDAMPTLEIRQKLGDSLGRMRFYDFFAYIIGGQL